MSFPEALAEPFVHDVLVVEGGAASAYLLARRTLLDQDDIEMLAQFTSRHRDAFDIDEWSGDTVSLADPDTDQRLQISVFDLQGDDREGDAVLVRTVETGRGLSAAGPALRIPATHVPLLRVVLTSRPTAEQLLGWVCRRSEILRPPIESDRRHRSPRGHADDRRCARRDRPGRSGPTGVGLTPCGSAAAENL